MHPSPGVLQSASEDRGPRGGDASTSHVRTTGNLKDEKMKENNTAAVSCPESALKQPSRITERGVRESKPYKIYKKADIYSGNVCKKRLTRDL